MKSSDVPPPYVIGGPDVDGPSHLVHAIPQQMGAPSTISYGNPQQMGAPSYVSYGNPYQMGAPSNVSYGNPQHTGAPSNSIHLNLQQMSAPSNVSYVMPQYMVAPAVDINQINDWLVWSIINLIVGWGTGLLPLIFSLVCRNNKNSNNISGARTMSTLALVFNILATVGGLMGWVAVIFLWVFVSSFFAFL
jgi:hypothetical protein